MNTWQKAGVVSLAAAALFAASVVAQGVYKTGQEQPVAAAAEEGTATHTITVTGKGTMEVAPDVAYVTLGVQTRAKTAEQAQNDNAKAFDQLEKVLRDTYHVAAKDMQTVGFHVNPEYRYAENKAPEVTGYVVSNTLQVTYRDLDRIGELLDAASKSGVNKVNGIRFATEKTDQYEIDVLDKAMANAKAKATAIAKTEERPLKGVMHVSQGAVSMPDGGFDQMLKTMDAASDSAYSTSISSGQLTISTTVTVQYEF